MRHTIEYIQKPIIDIVIAVAARGGGENCINMVGRFLNSKGFTIRVVQMVYEGTEWADPCMSFNFIYPSRNDHELKDFIDGYAKFLKNNGAPVMAIATAWPMMSYVAKRAAEITENSFTVASWLHAPLKMYDASGFGGGDFVKYADIHFVISNEIGNEIMKADPEGVIYRINNPVDFSKIHVVEKLGTNTLLFVGRLSEEKNIGIILCAIAMAKSYWKLKIVGDGDEKKKLKDLAKELKITDKVEFLGWTDDPWQYAEGSTALVLSSMYEGSPLVAIEAFGCGLPVIANVSSRVNELIVPGKNGYIYEDGNVNEFSKILDMISDNRFPKIDPQDCRDTIVNYHDKLALFDFYTKIYATVNKRVIKSCLWDSAEEKIIKDRINIVLPCYNVEKYLRRCLDSIINQTIGIEHLVIIAVNDASTDGTLGILQEYEKDYPDNICVVDCETNGGLSRARNIGMQYASEKYITFIDSDDCIAPDMLEKLFLADKCYPSDAVSCDFLIYDGSDIDYEQPDRMEADLTIEDKRQAFMDNAFLNSAWGKLYKTEFLLENSDLVFPDGYNMEDVYFTYMAAVSAKTWQHLNIQGYYYFQNSNGIMKSEKLKTYYMDLFSNFKRVTERITELGFEEEMHYELGYIYIKKVFLNILTFVSDAFTEPPTDNIRMLIEFMNQYFPDILNNPYLSAEEKEELKAMIS